MAFSHEPAAGYQHFPGVLFHHVRLPFFGHTFMASYHYAARESLVMGTCIRHPVTTGGNDHPAGADLVNVDTLTQGSTLYKQCPPSGLLSPFVPIPC